MSTIRSFDCKCAVCGKTNRYTVLCSTNAFGSPDLDLRPPEMQRSTMRLWVQECPDCGYVSEQVSNPTAITRDYLKTKEFAKCDGVSFRSDLAKKFYKRYKIALSDGEAEDAFCAVLHAAWASDDAGDKKSAKICREIAADLAEALILQGHERVEILRLVRADALRRSGHFSQVLNECGQISFSDETMEKVRKFQIKLALRKISQCELWTDNYVA